NSGVMLEPCGVWQLVQSSTAGSCSHRNGPRFSAWHCQQVSLTVFILSNFGPAAPCGLWQSVHTILPASIGCVEIFRVSARCSLWQGEDTFCCGRLVNSVAVIACHAVSLVLAAIPTCAIGALVACQTLCSAHLLIGHRIAALVENDIRRCTTVDVRIAVQMLLAFTVA